MEACYGSHHWARKPEKVGQKVRLMLERFIKALVMNRGMAA